MELEDRIKLFKDVFAPKKGEKVLFLVDTPHDDLKDNAAWIARREMAIDWFEAFEKLGNETGFFMSLLMYPATGQHNSPITQEVTDAASKSNIVLAMTEYSATRSLAEICKAEDSITRAASMPHIERRMEETAISADYKQVKAYAAAIERLLNNAVGAAVDFSTGDMLYIDLRNRVAEADDGDCSKTGQIINFPSGEGLKAPYEAVLEEREEWGKSKTVGILPVCYDGELVRYAVHNNKIICVIGDGKKAEEMRAFFAEDDTRGNIAELGIGCNPKAVVTGNVLEDEKVGLHIAYGVSSHLGGKVTSDVHQDIVYAKGCPIEGATLTLFNYDGSWIELISDAELRYDLLK